MEAEATPGTYDDTYAGGNILEEAAGEPNVKGFAEAAGEPKELDTTGVEGFGE
jgi:hypothetical protein